MTPRQPPLLAVPPKPLTPSQRELLRRYGSLEAQGVRLMRLGRQRRTHERQKASGASRPRGGVLGLPSLKRMS